MSKIYVGNLPWRVTDAQLTQLFSAHGDVTDARVVTDRETGRSRGFAFVTMGTPEAAKAAIAALNGFSMEGRALVVNEANEQGRVVVAAEASVAVVVDPADPVVVVAVAAAPMDRRADHATSRRALRPATKPAAAGKARRHTQRPDRRKTSGRCRRGPGDGAACQALATRRRNSSRASRRCSVSGARDLALGGH